MCLLSMFVMGMGLVGDAGGGMGWCVIIDSCLWSCTMIRVLCGNYYSLETTTLSKIHAIATILGLAGVVVGT